MTSFDHVTRPRKPDMDPNPWLAQCRTSACDAGHYNPYNPELLLFKRWKLRSFFILKSSLALSDSFEHLRYGSTAIRNMCDLSVRGSSLYRPRFERCNPATIVTMYHAWRNIFFSIKDILLNRYTLKH